MLQASFAYNK